MKKIPTLFERVFDDKHKIVDVLPNVIEGMEWVLEGEGIATEKVDGSCCAIIDGEFYKRYDAKKGKKIPDGAIPCCEPDEVTGHWPHWVKVEMSNPADKWFVEAYKNTFVIEGAELYILGKVDGREDKTYEAIGPHFQRNPYNLDKDVLKPHGAKEVEIERTFEGIKNYLSENYIEGIVFWKDGEPKCKIKRTDFGLEWNGKNTKL